MAERAESTPTVPATEAETVAARAEVRTRHWDGLASFVVSVLGLGVSIYLTIEHFTAGRTFACPESSTINCQKVTTSAWSHVGPIPVAVLGLVFFTGMSVLCLPLLWRVGWLLWLRVLGAVVGVVVALYLVWAELFRIHAICLYCTAVHVLSLLLLATVLWTTSELRAQATTR